MRHRRETSEEISPVGEEKREEGILLQKRAFEMLSETFVTSIRSLQKSGNTAVAKDVGIHAQTLNPTHSIDSTFKRSSTEPNCLAINSSHIFAAESGKAVVHVYSRDRSSQEALISFRERIHCVALAGEGVLVLGTAEGVVILWEVRTGRQVFTQASHLQPVSCLATTTSHLITGSEDSKVNIWSIPSLLSLAATNKNSEPVRTLSNHRAAINALAIGHSSSTNNIVLSASKDNTCIFWNYHTGTLLRTFLLHSTPLCAVLEPGDRAAYLGFEDGSIQVVDLLSDKSMINPLYDTALQSAPVQVDSTPWEARDGAVGSVHCIGLSYDGTSLLSGHASGKVMKWNTGTKSFSAEVVDLSAPVTNLIMLSPFHKTPSIKAVTVVKPRIGANNYTVTGQLLENLGTSRFQEAMNNLGIPFDMLERAIQGYSRQEVYMKNEELQKENKKLHELVRAQGDVLKTANEKYQKVKTGKNGLKD